MNQGYFFPPYTLNLNMYMNHVTVMVYVSLIFMLCAHTATSYDFCYNRPNQNRNAFRLIQRNMATDNMIVCLEHENTPTINQVYVKIVYVYNEMSYVAKIDVPTACTSSSASGSTNNDYICMYSGIPGSAMFTEVSVDNPNTNDDFLVIGNIVWGSTYTLETHTNGYYQKSINIPVAVGTSVTGHCYSYMSLSFDNCVCMDGEGLFGKECLECLPGEIGNIDLIGCEACDVGEYTNEAKSECVSCPAGTFSNRTDATSMSECTQCEEGKYSFTVGATSIGECKNCIQGRYGPDTGATAIAQCLACVAGKYSTSLGATSEEICENCGPGNSSTSGSQVCFECAAGYYKDVSISLSCTVCPEGTYNNQTGQGECTSCPAAKFTQQVAQISVEQCVSCSKGRFANSSMTSCLFCPRGSFQNEYGGSSCKECDPGSVALVEGSSECTDCEAGFYSTFSISEGLQVCTKCPNAKYSLTPRSQNCTQCPASSSTTRQGSTSVSDCACNVNFFGSAYSGNDCLPCPKSESASCPVNSTFPTIAAGYFINPSDPYDISACLPQEACKMSTTGKTECAEGYTGDFCGECITYEYFKVGNRCKQCPQTAGMMWMLLIAVLFAGSFLILKSSVVIARKIHSMSIAISWIQIISLFGSIPLDWPDSVVGLFDVMSILNFNLELFSTDCSVPMSYWTRWTFQILLPVYILCVFASMFFFHRFFGLFSSSRLPSLMATPMRDLFGFIRTGNAEFLEWKDPYKNSRYIYGATLLTTLSYTILVSTTLDPLNCVEQEDGSFRMLNNIEQECFTTDWYVLVYVLVVPLVLVYVIGIPAFSYLMIYRYRRTTSDEMFMRYFGSLVLSYRVQYEWFEILNMSMKTVFVLLLQFYTLFGTYNVQVFAALTLLYIALVAQYFLTPYQLPFNNSMAFVWISIAIFCLFAGVVFASSSVSTWEKDYFAALVFIMFLGGLAASVSLTMKERSFQKQFGVKKREMNDYEKQVVVKTENILERDSKRFKVVARIFPDSHAIVLDHMALLSPQVQDAFYEDLNQLWDVIEIDEFCDTTYLSPLVFSQFAEGSHQFEQLHFLKTMSSNKGNERLSMTFNPLMERSLSSMPITLSSMTATSRITPMISAESSLTSISPRSVRQATLPPGAMISTGSALAPTSPRSIKRTTSSPRP